MGEGLIAGTWMVCPGGRIIDGKSGVSVQLIGADDCAVLVSYDAEEDGGPMVSLMLPRAVLERLLR